MVLGIREGEALSVGSLSRPDMGFVMAVEEWVRPTDRRRRKPKRGSEMLKTCTKLGQHTSTVASLLPTPSLSVHTIRLVTHSVKLTNFQSALLALLSGDPG